MHEKHREFGRGEQLIQHAIELFDLVEIPPAAMAGQTIDRRFLQPDVLLVAPRYDKLARNSHRRIPLSEAYQEFTATGVSA